MKTTFKSIVKSLDHVVSKTHVSLFSEKKSLVTFLFHGLFNNESEVKLNHVAPQQAITTGNFRQFIEYYLKHDYLFVSPMDVIKGLVPNKNYALITFDDGYYNNHLALPILQEYKVPAVFFISANHILQNKCYWWDIVYRERIKNSTPIEIIDKEIINLKQQKNDQIERYIKDEFGTMAFHPIGDIDRPFNAKELKQFSENEFVFIGNHTCNHAILTNYSYAEMKSEILGAQKAIHDITGITPISIAYPNGDFEVDMIPIFKECGLKLGITVIGGKNYFPIDMNGIDAFLLNRFTLWGNKPVADQCTLFRSDIHLLQTIKDLLK